jgi:flagellar biosynthetic protein FlhB
VAGDDDKASKTEQPTPYKLEKAREEGQLPFSKEVGSVVTVFGGALAALSFGSALGGGMSDALRNIYRRIGEPSAPLDGLLGDLGIMVAVPVFGIMLFTGALLLMVSYAQVGALWTWKPLKPQLSRLNPMKRLQQMIFSVQGISELLKSIFKICGLSFVGYLVLASAWKDFPILLHAHPAVGMIRIGELAVQLVFSVAALLTLIAAADILYVRWKHNRDQMMSIKDVRDETKNKEGSPEIKGKRRQRQFEMAQNRLSAAVPTADVVVTNPTHFAVAIRYDSEANGAPVVVAKGADRVAFKIREIARENGVAVQENRFLARILYAKVKVGAEIPDTLWQAVAEVLRQVDHIRQQFSRRLED